MASMQVIFVRNSLFMKMLYIDRVSVKSAPKNCHFQIFLIDISNYENVSIHYFLINVDSY